MKACVILVATTILVSFISGIESITTFTNDCTGIESTTINVKNNCPWTIWPATLASATSPQLGNTGIALAQGATASIAAVPKWEGRVWARAFCTTAGAGKFTCPVGDCGSGQVECKGRGGAPPMTVAEFRLNGAGNKDSYGISLVNGSNLPMSIEPMTSGCPATSCSKDLNAGCPPEVAVRGSSSAGVIGCRGACLAFDTDEYCCRGTHNTPQTCPASNYANYFKSLCPQASSYALDSATLTCNSGGDYRITFCP